MNVPTNILPEGVSVLAKVPVVDADECTGCELCVDEAPNTFRMNDDGVTEVIMPPGDGEEAIQAAIDGCPSEAISWAE